MNVDPHEVLGVAPDATEEEIRAAYSRLVRRHHPDRHVNAPADVRDRHATRMAEVTGALRLLQNPDALARHRAARARAAGPSDGESSSRGAGDPGRRAGSNRGGGPGTDRAGRGEDATGSTFDYRRAAASEFTTSAEKPPRGSRAVGSRVARASGRARGRGRGGGRLVWAALVVVLVGILAWWLMATPEGLEWLDSVVGRGRAAWNVVA